MLFEDSTLMDRVLRVFAEYSSLTAEEDKCILPSKELSGVRFTAYRKNL
jgi:hypothetical protein